MDFSYPCLALYQYIKSFFSLPFGKTWKLLSLSILHSPSSPFTRVPLSIHLSIFIVSIYLKEYSLVSFPEIPRIYIPNIYLYFYLHLSHRFSLLSFFIQDSLTWPHNKESYDFMVDGRQHRAFIGPTIGQLMARWIQIRRVSRRPPHNFFILPRRTFVCTAAVVIPTTDVTP